MSIREQRKDLIIKEMEKSPDPFLRWTNLKKLTSDPRWGRYQKRARSVKGKIPSIKRGSYTDLSDCLKELKEEGKIDKVRASRKKIFYMLTEDAKLHVGILNELKQKTETLSEALEEIHKSKEELTLEQARNWITGFTFFGLRQFLGVVEEHIRSEEKWAYHLGLVLTHFIHDFEAMLLEFWRTYPDLMDSAFETVVQELDSLALHYTPKKGEVFKS